MPDYLILGCGYTASRVARKLLALGSNVTCTNRHAISMAGANRVALDTRNKQSLIELSRHLSKGLTVLHSIPESTNTSALLDVLRPFHPTRFVYLSTTGVYGSTGTVDENTKAAPETERDKERWRTEQLIAAGPWSSLVLRPAAIYGPNRGIHTSARTGIFRSPPGGNRIVSRIHVDDLANHVLAGLGSEISGTFPVADEEPCTSLGVAESTCSYLGISLSLEQERTRVEDSKKGRLVDGSGYRRKLGLQLQFPSFRQGIPACLSAETVLSG